MKSYGYAVIVKNDESLSRDTTYIPTKHKKTKYAMLIREVHKDKSETLVTIKYDNDISNLQESAKKYPTWYNYPMGITKNLQGYLREI
jgi:hypothetical protein